MGNENKQLKRSEGIESELLDERVLLSRIAERGREQALAEVIRRYGTMVYSAAYRISGDRGWSEEVAQDVFLLLLEKAGELREPQVLGGWLYRAAVNFARVKLRAAGRRAHYEEAAAGEGVELTEDGRPEPWAELVPFLDSAIEGISESLRRPILLCYLEGVPQKEASNLIGCSESTLSRRLKAGLEALREQFRGKGIVATTACLGFALTEGVKGSALGYRSSTLIESILAKAPVCMEPLGAAATGLTLKSTLLSIMKFKKGTALAAAVIALVAITSTLLLDEEENEKAATEGLSASVEDSLRSIENVSTIDPATVVDDRPVAPLSLEEKRRLLASVAFLKSPRERWEALRKVGFDLTLEEVEQLPKGVSANDLIKAMLEAWLRKDPLATVAWSEENEILNGNLFYLWASIDASAALVYARDELPGDFRGKESLLQGLGIIAEPLVWVDRLSRIENAEERAKLIGELGSRWLEQDPVSAVSWFDSQEDLSKQERAGFLSGGLHEIAQVDAVKALEYLQEIPVDEDRRSYQFHVRQVMRNLAIQGYKEIGSLLESFPAEDRPSAIEGLAGGMAQENVAAAMDWALELESRELPRALKGIVPEADPESFESLMNTMLEKPASPEIDSALLSWMGLEADYLDEDKKLFRTFLDTRSAQEGEEYVAMSSKGRGELNQALWRGRQLLSKGIAQSEGPRSAIEWLDTIPLQKNDDVVRVLAPILSIWKFVDRDEALVWVEGSSYSDAQKEGLRSRLRM